MISRKGTIKDIRAFQARENGLTCVFLRTGVAHSFVIKALQAFGFKLN